MLTVDAERDEYDEASPIFVIGSGRTTFPSEEFQCVVLDIQRVEEELLKAADRLRELQAEFETAVKPLLEDVRNLKKAS